MIWHPVPGRKSRLHYLSAFGRTFIQRMTQQNVKGKPRRNQLDDSVILLDVNPKDH